jgi:hydrogenase/urease accessory protein HupE
MFATNVLKITGWQLDPTIAYILIGIVGAILLSVLFEWALIFFTSLTGAMLITRSITLQPSIETGLIILLVVLGIVIQSRIRPSRRVVTKET